MLLTIHGNVQMVIGQLGDASAPGCPGQEAQLHQIGFVYIFQGNSFFKIREATAAGE